MDRGIWATWYDLDEKDREPFRDAVKRKPPADLPLPGKFRENGTAVAPEASATEENA